MTDKEKAIEVVRNYKVKSDKLLKELNIDNARQTVIEMLALSLETESKLQELGI